MRRDKGNDEALSSAQEWWNKLNQAQEITVISKWEYARHNWNSHFWDKVEGKYLVCRKCDLKTYTLYLNSFKFPPCRKNLPPVEWWGSQLDMHKMEIHKSFIRARKEFEEHKFNIKGNYYRCSVCGITIRAMDINSEFLSLPKCKEGKNGK